MNALIALRADVARHGIGRMELAAAADVTAQTVQRILDDGDANPTIETLGKLTAGVRRVLKQREAEAEMILTAGQASGAAVGGG